MNLTRHGKAGFVQPIHNRLSGCFRTPPIRRLICVLAWLVAVVCRGDAGADAFYAPPPNAGAQLPADGIFPQGRKLAFMGFSGDPARDLTNGFTVAGPVYHNQTAYLARCASNSWPAVAQIGLPKSALTAADQSIWRQQIQTQVRVVAGDKNIAWWAVIPEELRPWNRIEMDYLQVACAAIRTNDPQHRPIYLYNPNHRNAQTLAPIARQVDIVAKGCYVNNTGHKRDRVWVRWSVEQEIAAIQKAGRPGAIPLLNPELSQDTEPSEDKEIRAWVRHDVYLGLATGAKGVLIWSLHPRTEVQRTWQLWYDAYAECGRELNGPHGLAQVFLFGERRSDLKVRLVTGEATSRVTLGGTVEAGTTSEAERATREVKLPAWTSVEYAYGNSRWLFIINSSNDSSRFEISGWPKNSQMTDAMTDMPILLGAGSRQFIDLPAYGVLGIRFRNLGQ
jgi:hypothetical protein